MLTVFFTACSDDDDPDYTLYDKSEIIGTQNGKIKYSVTQGSHDTYTANAQTKFQKITNNANDLNLFTDEIGGPIVAYNFKKDDGNNQYTFWTSDVKSVTMRDEEIPSFVKNWYSNFELSKVEFLDLKLQSNAIYAKATKTIGFTYKGTLKVYEKESATSTKDVEVGTNTILIEYFNLKK